MPTQTSSYLMFELIVTCGGMFIQLFNISYSFIHAFKRPSVYNVFLTSAMVLYLLAFFPLLLSSSVGTASFTDNHDILVRANLKETSAYAHLCFFSISTLFYTLLIQKRFQIIRFMHSYSRVWDHVFVTLTIFIWSYCCVYRGILQPKLTSILYGAIWSFYGLVVDNAISYIFVRTVITASATTKDTLDLARKLKMSCLGLSFASWLCLVIAFVSTKAVDPSLRQFLYRVGFSFSPLMYSSALYLIYCIPTFFELVTKELEEQKLKLATRNMVKDDESITSQSTLGSYQYERPGLPVSKKFNARPVRPVRPEQYLNDNLYSILPAQRSTPTKSYAPPGKRLDHSVYSISEIPTLGLKKKRGEPQNDFW